jgi:integrase
MKQTDESVSKAKSASRVQAGGASKLSARYWIARVKQVRGHGFYFAQLQHAGRRTAVCLQTTDRRQAAETAAKAYGQIRAQGWDAALRALDPDKHRPQTGVTVGDIFDTLARLDMRPSTRTAYRVALQWWALQVIRLTPLHRNLDRHAPDYRTRIAALPLTHLAIDQLERVRDEFIAGAGDDAIAARRARVSVKAFARNAKAGIRAAQKLGRLEMPVPTPFTGLTVAGAVATRYVAEFDAAEMLRRASETLRVEDPSAFKVVLLALGAGLRRGEIQHLQWRSIDTARRQIRVEASGAWLAKNIQSEATVDVDGGLIAALGTPAGPDDPVVDPLAIEHAVRWLRRQGVTSAKPLHSLRKEFGSIVAQTADLLTASRQLRHGSLAVTAGIYIENRRKASPNIASMLNGGDA